MTDRSARRAGIDAQTPGPLSARDFHLNEILSLFTGLPLAREGAAALHRLVAFVMQTEAGAAHTAAGGETVKRCLEEQLPFLADIRVAEAYEICRFNAPGADAAENPYLRVWLEMQQLRYGALHRLLPLALWREQKRR
jgi:hypothetical protein